LGHRRAVHGGSSEIVPRLGGEQASLRARAGLLVAELAATARTGSLLPEAREIASTVIKTFQILDIAALPRI